MCKQFLTFSACLVCLFITKIYTDSTTNIRQGLFIKRQLCNIEKRLQYGYSWIETNTSSWFDCILNCQQSDVCVGASTDWSTPCFMHRLFPPGLNNCTSYEISNPHTYLEPFCVQGFWNDALKQCVCSLGASGERCDQYPKSCLEFYNNGGEKLVTGNVTLDPAQDGLFPFKTECRYGALRKFMVFFRNFGAGFNRSWFEFEFGFYIDSLNFWIGLYNLRAINTHETNCNRLTFEFEYMDETNNEIVIRRLYDGFRVLAPETGYMFDFSQSILKPGNPKELPGGSFFGDCFGPYKGTARFSTYDKDQDNDVNSNCASKYGSGWWYDGCNPVCNLLGRGIGSWDQTPPEERMSIVGINMSHLNIHGNVLGFSSLIRC